MKKFRFGLVILTFLIVGNVAWGRCWFSKPDPNDLESCQDVPNDCDNLPRKECLKQCEETCQQVALVKENAAVAGDMDIALEGRFGPGKKALAKSTRFKCNCP